MKRVLNERTLVAALALGLTVAAAGDAKAQFRYYSSPSYGGFYTPGHYQYSVPAYSYTPRFYQPRVVPGISFNFGFQPRYVTPYWSGYGYRSYSPGSFIRPNVGFFGRNRGFRDYDDYYDDLDDYYDDLEDRWEDYYDD